VSPKRGVTLLACRGVSTARPPALPAVSPPALRQCYRRRQTTEDDRRQRAKQYWPIRRASNKTGQTDRQTDRRQTQALRFPLDAASVIRRKAETKREKNAKRSTFLKPVRPTGTRKSIVEKTRDRK